MSFFEGLYAAALQPIEDQTRLDLINKHQPAHQKYTDISKLVTISGVAADNFINRTNLRWGKTELKQLSGLIVGKPFLLDHDRSDVGKSSIGRVYRAGVSFSSTAPNDVIDAIGVGDYNRQIISTEGYAVLVFDAFLDKQNQIVKKITNSTIKELSLGGFVFTDYWCPVCDTSAYMCPHTIQYPGLITYNDNVAPYFTRKNVVDLCEVSAVAVPNLPMAKIIAITNH